MELMCPHCRYSWRKSSLVLGQSNKISCPWCKRMSVYSMYYSESIPNRKHIMCDPVMVVEYRGEKTVIDLRQYPDGSLYHHWPSPYNIHSETIKKRMRKEGLGSFDTSP